MNGKVVVMGGSFNPPTIAHLKLMKAAIEAVDAQHGVFVPTAHDYVVKKMKKQGHPEDVLSEPVRLSMLESFCKTDGRMSVSRIQMSETSCGYDYEMLVEIRKAFPGMEIYFVLGSDKLYILPRWHRIDELLSDFHILVARRGSDDLNTIKKQYPYLAGHWDRFTVFDAPDGISGISSSNFREKLRAGDDSAHDLVTPEVMEILAVNGAIPQMSITEFRQRYHFLSNFYESRILYGGIVYGSGEAAFQAQKCTTDMEKLRFTGISPGQSKRTGRHVRLRADWEQVKTGIMEEVVRAKFTQNPELAGALLATGRKVLVEGNHWGDTCWGVDIRTGQGENRLGKILMKVREEMRPQ